jgi:hypothetical protein
MIFKNLVLPISQDFTKWISIYTFFRLEHNFSQDKLEHLVIANLYCLAQFCVTTKAFKQIADVSID